jgi:hypothetical protein
MIEEPKPYTIIADKPIPPLGRWRRFWWTWRNALGVSLLEVELRRTKELNRDLEKQVRELLKATPMTPEQLEEFKLIRRDNERMKKECDILTVYLRTRYPKDFQSGIHGQRTLSQIVVHYMGRLKDAPEKKEDDALKAPL